MNWSPHLDTQFSLPNFPVLGGYRFNVHFDRKEMDGGGSEYPSKDEDVGNEVNEPQKRRKGIEADLRDQILVGKSLTRSKNFTIFFFIFYFL